MRALKRICSCKIWLRYSRERALSSLPDQAVQGAGRAQPWEASGPDLVGVELLLQPLDRSGRVAFDLLRDRVAQADQFRPLPADVVPKEANG